MNSSHVFHCNGWDEQLLNRVSKDLVWSSVKETNEVLHSICEVPSSTLKYFAYKNDRAFIIITVVFLVFVVNAWEMTENAQLCSVASIFMCTELSLITTNIAILLLP